MAEITVLHSTEIDLGADNQLCLHYGIWVMENGTNYRGYRFMYRRDGRLKTDRGQARIPSRKHAEILWAQADLEGWADLDEDSN